MGAVSNEVEICNLALLRINQTPITALNENSMQAKACDKSYVQSRQSLLSQYSWTFAIETAIPSLVNDRKIRENENEQQYNARVLELFQYGYKFQFPNECLRIISIYNSFGSELSANNPIKSPWNIQKKHIFTDYPSIYVKYIKDTVDVTSFSPQFIDCFILDLAIRLTKYFNDSTTYLQQLKADYDAQFALAKISDCQQDMLGGITSYPMLYESWEF